MLSYIKKYPISLFIILTVIYLSFFKPPKTDLNEIPNLDKLVHICMYFGMSGMLWLEFLRAHRRDDAPLWHAWVGAFLCPIPVSYTHLDVYKRQVFFIGKGYVLKQRAPLSVEGHVVN